MELHIALCTDDNYANHCAIGVTSILENNKNDTCHIYILTVGLTEKNRNRFKYLADFYHKEIDVVTVDGAEIEGLQSTHRLPSSMYLRFLLPDIVNAHKCLYLDSDIICRESLREVFETGLTNMAVGAVEDQCGDDIRIHNSIDMYSRYFNSGVLLMNLDYWREHQLKKKLISYVEMSKKLTCPDQDALNVCLEGKVVFLDYRYNFQQGMYGNLDWLSGYKHPAIEVAKQNPLLVHYTSSEKPWHKDCKHPLKAEYNHYMGLHPILCETKTWAHPASYYIVEAVTDSFKRLYHKYRKKSGLL